MYQYTELHALLQLQLKVFYIRKYIKIYNKDILKNIYIKKLLYIKNLLKNVI